MNGFKTFILLVVMAGLFMFVGSLFGPTGLIIAFILALILNFTSYYYSDKIVLSMYRAQPVDEASSPHLYRMVRGLAEEAQMPMPKVYIIPTGSPNAFATGRDPNHAAVAVTNGILGLLSYDELRAVVAHELAHVKNRDTLIMTAAATIVAAIGLLANFGRFAMFFTGGDRRDGGNLISLLIWIIVAPIIAMIIQLAISRMREYGADSTGAHISRQPLMLASALRKISAASEIRPQDDLANPSTAHLFIASPFSGGFLASLLSTHPPIAERIRRLEQMAERGT